MDQNPLFIGGGIYALRCTSPCIDFGQDSSIADDSVDIDLDGLTNDPGPFDVIGFTREVNSVSGSEDVDMGAYEHQEDGCSADANHDGVVDVDDLVAVILNWGSCPGSAAGCLGDVHTAPCGNASVDADDLTAIILGWGPCDDAFPMTPPGEVPQSLQDCWDECATKHEFGSAEWQICVEACVEAIEELN
jgi:hypothetical protein